MHKGISTLDEYDECIRKGLCEEHSNELNENGFGNLQLTFSKMAFRFVRVNVLYPFLNNKPPRCEKIKKVMERTPNLAKIFIEGNPEHNISEEAANVILIVDSVVIFTICQLSKICCTGALFHIKKKSNDPNITAFQNLLLVERLNAKLGYLFPVLEKNFVGLNMDIIRATHCITLLFIRKFCNKGSLRKAVEVLEHDILANCGLGQGKVFFYEQNAKNLSWFNHKTSKQFNYYSFKDYVIAFEHFYSAEKFDLAIFYGYLAIAIEDTVGEVYFPLIKTLLKQSMVKEAFNVISYALKQYLNNPKHFEKLNIIKGSLSKYLTENGIEIPENYFSSVNHNGTDTKDKILSNIKEKAKSGLVDLVDSDSGGSDSEDKKENNSKKKGGPKNKSAEATKENAASQDLYKIVAAIDSDDESENKQKKQMINGTKEKTKNKPCSRRKRTTSESSVDNQPDEAVDINKINSYLKEASEALLADCGYKAVQIFRGPLRKFIDSSDFLSFEECDVVCIKYSYGIAYCKSGGHDDLEKCIVILKDIIEKHDSITFPAAYYSLGLAFRKLNRFKEALNYLEIVQNFLDKRIHFKIYPWPGMTNVIQETKPDILKDLVQVLIKECENPPNPDAFCRYENCYFQPTIYYTDPDFKGYVSLSCSEQCNLQYHLQCWKTIKEEKNLTDKEFLEKQCFTPDCGGFFAKIQNIDKKGDLSKEFISEFKRPQKLPKKWEKKTDVKDKKKKKTTGKSEGGSQETLTENGKVSSRKNSVCDGEIIKNRRDRSRDSSVCDTETTSQFSDSCISNEEIPFKLESNQKSSKNSKLEAPVSSSSNCVSSYPKENVYTHLAEDFREPIPSQEKEIGPTLIESIKSNTYSYMADFLRHHGPLRIDDPLLNIEIDSFPEEVYNIVTECGGIGEFLKDDLEFAFVGDLYVCVVDDLAKAYQMLNNASLPSDFKMQTFENSANSKYYSENENLSDSQNSSFLNPDAQEYTPYNNKNTAYKFEINSLNPEDINSHSSLPLNLDSPYKCSNSISQLDTFPTTEIFASKSKSCEAVSNSKSPKNKDSYSSSSYTKEKNSCVINKSEPNMLNSVSELDNKGTNQDSVEKKLDFYTNLDKKSIYDNSNGSTENADLKCKEVGTQLLNMLNHYFSEEMAEHRQSMSSFLKPYLIKKLDESVSDSASNDIELQLEKSKSAAIKQELAIEGLEVEIFELSKQNSSLQNVLECTTEQQQKLTDEVARLKKCLNESAAKFERLKKESDQKQKDLQNEKESLVQSLTNANKYIGTMQQKSATLVEEKLKLQKTVDNLILSGKEEEIKMKTVLDAQEIKFKAIIESLQKENAELKNRTKHAELQVLFMKKTEYLKKIEAKSLEVNEVLKEMNSPSMQLWANAAGPDQMKILATKLNKYCEELKIIRQDFIEKVDEQITKVKNGTSLKDLKEVVTKDLAPVPTYKSILPENLLAGVSKFNSMTLPYFGTSAHLSSTPGVSAVPTTSPLLSAAASLKVISPSSATTTKVIPPVPSVIPAKTIASLIPADTAKIISPVAPIIAANHIPSVTLSSNIIPSCTPSVTPPSLTSSSSVPVSKVKKESKIDLTNDIDPTIQESFKNAMASINSFASTPYPVPSLDEEFDKNCVVFKHPEPVSNNTNSDHPKVPPGLVNSVSHSASARASAITPIPEPVVKSSGAKSFASLDTIPKIKETPNQHPWASDKKKTTDSYVKLLGKLKELFPTYSQEELISYVKEVRTRRQGKLSGLTIDAIIAEISAIMKAKKKIPDPKVQPKPAKILVNKKLVPDPKPPSEPQTTKKKSAWNIDPDAAQRMFSGSADDDCTICCDPMTNSAYKVACGHFFHEDCIRQWLKKNSNCPICRVLLLLPEEYPSLS